MEPIHVKEIINQIYSDYQVPEGLKIGDIHKKDFERQAFYRGLNKIDPKEKELIEVYESILTNKLGIGIAAARMILFRIGIFLEIMGVDHR